MEPLFETQDLAFGGFLYYDSISIQLGRITFIEGESGSGKSTLFRLMNGVCSPSRGNIFYRGQNVTKLDPIALRQEVSLISQDVYLFDGTIRFNFQSFCQYRKTPPPSDASIQKWLDLFLLDFGPDNAAGTLSGGERQRLFCAIFMSFKPKVLLLDEPTSALDDKTGMQILSNIIGHCKTTDTELIAISHNSLLSGVFAENTITIKRRGSE